ncbi:MAG: transferrin-binding protein-like solute binding protein, partial [Cardiobacteriaceae bacterium]|nr:transferrin-binding protein-like solute binding protein [Cardiobacteriaceae bacterium]
VCAAVLSACGGSSSSTDTSAADAEKAKQEAAQKAAAEKQAKVDALVKAAVAAGLTDAQAAQFAGVEANLALDTSSDAFKAAITAFLAEQQKASWATAANGATSAPGYKLVQKVESDFALLTGSSNLNASGGAQRMGVQDPNRRLDNIVVAQPKEGTVKDAQGTVNAIYLEEFDFSTGSAVAGQKGATFGGSPKSTTGANAVAGLAHTSGAAATLADVATKGYIQLQNLYINETTRGGDPVEDQGVGRGAGATEWSKNLVGATTPYTRTEKEGKKTGTVLLFQTGRADYTETAGYEGGDLALAKVAVDADLDGSNKAAFKKTDKSETTKYRTAGTVAEVYGYRTFADASVIKVTEKERGDHAQANLPLVNYVKKDDRSGALTGVEYKGAQLKHVQYGRVTSSLHEDELDNMKMGVLKDTRVASYGLYGNEGTENNYFYRGVDSTNEEQLAKVLAAAKTEGKLTYEGHAVTYGLAKDPRKSDGVIPTALSGAPADNFFSGTHVAATINVADNSVEGSLFNRFTTVKDDEFTKVNLVTFKGQLGKDGNIVGSSELAYDTTKGNKEGSFNATLYGAEATEMGGALASTKTDADQWGAVFGATKGKTSSGIRESVDGSTSGK